MSLPSKPDPIYVNCADHIHGTRYQVQTLVPVMIYIQEDSENNIHVVPPVPLQSDLAVILCFDPCRNCIPVAPCSLLVPIYVQYLAHINLGLPFNLLPRGKTGSSYMCNGKDAEQQ